MRYLGIKYLEVPALCHKKIGSVESKMAVVRNLINRLLIDPEHAFLENIAAINHEEVLSKANYLSNIMFCNKKLRSFDLVKCYAPALVGLPRRPISKEMYITHQEKFAKRKPIRINDSPEPWVL